MAIEETRVLPSPVLEGSLTAFLKNLDFLQKGAIKRDAAGEPTFAGIDTSAYAPQIAGQHALQTGAVSDAAGLASLVGPGAGEGPGTVSAYMSPYQQQVIDAQMQEFDRQAGIQRLGIGDQALGVGAYGGGRHGVQMAEFAKGSDMNRALLQGQL